MGIFDFLRKKTEPIPRNTVVQSVPEIFLNGRAVAEKVEVDFSIAESLRSIFIAFDVETTGFSSITDRIVEIGAVLFVNGTPVKRFGTLVNPKVSISASASTVNHISNDMLCSAPLEKEVYPQLMEFLGESLTGNIILCAHNAKFDFDFLCNTLSRLGYNANIKYVDTLSLSRNYIKGLCNYKQGTLENYFGLNNNTAHRALSDAEICGKILLGILDCANEALEEEKRHNEKATPTADELIVCAYIQSIITENGGDIKWLRYRKNASNYVEATCLYSFLKFKHTKKGKYIIVKNNEIGETNLPRESCSVAEGGTEYIRIYFNSPFELGSFSNYILNNYFDCAKSMQEYMARNNHAQREAEMIMRNLRAISSNEMELLIVAARSNECDISNCEVQMNKGISKNDVFINALHNRVSLCEIVNFGNWEKGFDAGYPYWEQGETARKDGQIDKAINLFDKARYYGYDAPALYESFAKAYRQIQDYDNEIVIIEEGIERLGALKRGVLEARKEKAIKLLYARQQAERNILEKVQAKEKRTKERETSDSAAKPSQGRSVLQMTDDGTILKEFETIAAAVKEVGVNSKCIRDAANGVQKHAGGYCWKYKE